MKVIGVSQRIVSTREYVETRDALSHDWLIFFKQLGIDFVLIPNDPVLAINMVKNRGVTGLLLTGGNDLPLTSEGALDVNSLSVRDQTELALLKYSVEHKVPTIGVCRGAQLINLYYSGKLKPIGNTNHVNTHHTITLTEHFFSCEMNTFHQLSVNSYHNYRIDNLAEHELKAWAISDDNCIEAIKHISLPIWGIMWHPERQLVNKDIHVFNDAIMFKQVFGL